MFTNSYGLFFSYSADFTVVHDFKSNYSVGLIYYLSLKNEALEINKSFKTRNTFKGKIGVFEIKDNKINHQLNFYEINNGELKEIF